MIDQNQRLSQIAIWVSRWYWLLLVVAAPFLLFPSVTSPLPMLIVPGVWIVGARMHRNLLLRTPLNLSLLLLALMALISLFVTDDIGFSLSKIAGLVLGFGVFFAFAREGRQARGWWLCLVVFGATGLGMSALALATTAWSNKLEFLSPLMTRTPYLLGLSGAEKGTSPNELAGLVVWIIPVFLAICLCMFSESTRWRQGLGVRRFFAGLTMSLAMTAFLVCILLLTQSRGGYLGCGVAAVMLVFAFLSRRGRFIFALSLMLVLLIGIEDMRLRGEDPVNVFMDGSSMPFSAEAVNSWELRARIWSGAISAIQDYPWTGLGMNNFRRVFRLYDPNYFSSRDVDISHAHNEFLQAALDLGVPGLVAFIALYFGAAIMLGAIWARVGTMMPNCFSVCAVVLGLGAGLFAHLMYGMTDAVTLWAKPGVLFWMLLGLIAGLYEQMRSGDLIKWSAWFGPPLSREVPPLPNPEALDD